MCWLVQRRGMIGLAERSRRIRYCPLQDKD